MCFNPIKLLIHRSEENSLIPEIDELGGSEDIKLFFILSS